MASNSNSSFAAPSSADELVAFIVQSVRQQYDRNRRRIDGSYLAHLVRSEYPGLDYSQLGLTRLADAVRIAVARGQLVRHDDVQHLEVSPPATQPETPALGQSTDWDRLFVRPDLWKALMLTPDAPAFLEKTTLNVTFASPADANHYTNDARFLFIPKIDEERQVDWAKQFLKSRTDVSAVSVTDPIDLVHWRAKVPRSVARDWKAFRSAKVVNFVRQWSVDNALNLDQLLVPPRRQTDTQLLRTGRSEQSTSESALRSAVIAAVEEMPMANLEQLAIPLRYVLRHFRPR